MEGSVSDNSSGDSGKTKLRKKAPKREGHKMTLGAAGAQGDGEADANDLAQVVASGRGQKLSRANMKKHDRQWALLISLNGHGPSGDQNGSGRAPNERNGSLEETLDSFENPLKPKKSRRGRKKKRRVSLPVVLSSLCRSFPLPGPAQIESYLKAYDSVDLNTRSNSPQNSSSPDNMSVG